MVAVQPLSRCNMTLLKSLLNHSNIPNIQYWIGDRTYQNPEQILDHRITCYSDRIFWILDKIGFEVFTPLYYSVQVGGKTLPVPKSKSPKKPQRNRFFPGKLVNPSDLKIKTKCLLWVVLVSSQRVTTETELGSLDTDPINMFIIIPTSTLTPTINRLEFSPTSRT